MNEAERLFLMFVEYAKETGETHRYDISEILEGFEKDVLSKYTDVSALARKWSSIIKDYRKVDPRGQSKLSGFY